MTRHVRQTAQTTGRSCNTVLNILVERNLYEPWFPEPSADEIARMIDLYRQNRSVKLTARPTGWSHRRVKGVLVERTRYTPEVHRNPKLTALHAEWKRKPGHEQ
ncbi:hypothetical protein [Amycolatopsis rubida]|uniref:Uncharacterized protein n=1 Tax=Amycolatopsis rubida TaxID=112413 RepID=A0A1I5XAG7_9PSEU|nr:hypothetical protein [Amycolatopsis rubida]SFQ28973.1 hypothetical protein SAMN05421854_110125 [Amycolatopsis rubida]